MFKLHHLELTIMKSSQLENVTIWLMLIPVSLIILSILLLFPYALFIHTIALIDGLAASQEWGGEPGTVTITGKGTISTSRGKQTKCLGEFISADGHTSRKVIVRTPSPCESGKIVPARFVKGQNTFLFGLEQDIAWVKGSKDWILNLLLVMLFAAMSILSALPIVLITKSILKKKRAPRDQQN